MKTAIRPVRRDVHAVALIAAPEDWAALQERFPDLRSGIALGSEWKSRAFGKKRLVFVQTGADAVSAAAIAQHAADQWRPAHIIVIGAPGDSAYDAFVWVADRNRLPMREEPSLASLLNMLEPVSAPVPEPQPAASEAVSIVDAVVPFADRSSE